jgi:hypothetical protein
MSRLLMSQGLDMPVGAVEIGANGVRVRQVGGNLQRIMAGIPRTVLVGGTTAEVAVTVSEPFRPEILIFADDATLLDLNNLRIGTKSLNVTSNPVSGNCFQSEAIDTHIIGYTAQAGVGFVLSVANNTLGNLTLTGGCFGVALN